MVNVHRHNPALRQKLKTLIDESNAAGLLFLLKQLSNSEARTAGYLMGEEILPAIAQPEAFLDLFLAVVPSNAKAFLGTFLKAATALYKKGKCSLTDARWQTYASQASAIDARKVLDAFLPIAKTAEDVQILMTTFAGDDTDTQAAFLLRGGTTVCYYQLFHSLRRAEDHREILKKYYILLVQKGDHRSYNMASIIRNYFDLTELPGQFSLNLPPYKFNRLELTLESFAQILNQ